VIGRIEGEAVEVATKTPVGIETDAAPTVVASGSDVTLHSGRALLLLNAGGEISICGPAHFKLIQSAGSVTLALDYGRVHPSLTTTDGFTIYTPTIVATPIAITEGLRDLTLGLEETGEMCVLTARGAMRVETQFSNESIIVPQGGTVSLAEGQVQSLHADAATCSCDYPRAKMEPPKPAAPLPNSQPPSEEIGTLAAPKVPERKRVENSSAPAATTGEPVYTVLMPPLSFDASSPEPSPDPAPETIRLVREVRVRPTVEFRGHVNPAPAQEIAVRVVPPAPAGERPAPPPPGVFDRVRTFFRKLVGKSS
jgi:hypothetical protein